MYKTAKDVDAHVRVSFAKMRSEHDRNQRAFTIAKLYYNVGEFRKAEQYALLYLKVHEKHDPSYRLLGYCYLGQDKPDKALESFQQSLKINPRQTDVLKEVCKLLLNDKNFNGNKAKYWCDLAESQKVTDDCILSLRSRIMNSSNLDVNQYEALLLKEITAYPDDAHLRTRLVQNYLQHKKLQEAFDYVYQLEMQLKDEFSSSVEWYNTVWLVLTKCESLKDIKKDWEFFLLLAICLERQVFLSLKATSSDAGLAESANYLFTLDQSLQRISKTQLNISREFGDAWLDHFRGQLLLHLATYIFKREISTKKSTWRKTVNATLPLLLLAYQIKPMEEEETWIKQLDEKKHGIVKYWKREGSFRSVQAGRTLLSFINEPTLESEEEQSVSSLRNLNEGWSSYDDFISHIRQICADKLWRHNIFVQVFSNSEHKLKEKTSLFANSNKLEEPVFELPSYAEVERFEEKAQFLKPHSLQHLVYLSLSTEKLHEVRMLFFSGLPFTTKNLSQSSIESLSELDFECFLYATVIQAKRVLEVEHTTCSQLNEIRDDVVRARPHMLPFANIFDKLCTEEQAKWWSHAIQSGKKVTNSEKNAEMRINLQVGLEAVRGVNGIKMDAIIVFKLAQILNLRALNCCKSDAAALEARVELLFKHGLHMMKLKTKGALEPFQRYFRYANANTAAAERELNKAAEIAIDFLKVRYFKKKAFEPLIEELKGLQLPMATYFQAESYQKLDENNKNTRHTKQFYVDKASECLNQTLLLLKSTDVDPNHPLNSVIHAEIRRLQQQSMKFLDESQTLRTPNHNNSSTYEEAETDVYADDYSFVNHSRRHMLSSVKSPPVTSQQNSELENLCKQMGSTLTLLKDEILENIKPEIISMRKEIVSLNEKITVLEQEMKKTRVSSASPNCDEDNVLDDLYMIEDLQNQLLQQNQPHGNTSSAFSSVAAGPIANIQSQFNLQQPRISTPNAMHNVAAAAAAAAFNSPMFNAMNYYTPPPYMMQSQGQGANTMIGQRNPLNLPYIDANSGINFNMPSIPSLLPPSNQDTRGGSAVYNLLTQQPVLPTQPNINAHSNLSTQATMPTQQILQPATTTANAQPPSSLLSLSSTPAFLPQFGNSIATNTSTSAVTTASSAVTLNKLSFSKQPIEKGPPANVVITSSDPLPNPQSASLQTQQPTLSVTIPSYHIKQTTTASAPQLSTVLPQSQTSNAGVFSFNSNGNIFTGFGDMAAATANTNAGVFSFKPKSPDATSKKIDNSLKNLNTSNDTDKSTYDAELEYDPRPDFKPIIPLPDEIVVRTGEEDETVMFCHRAKLYRRVEKEWKERGTGDIKILKAKDGHSRILMRRDQTHKICANHIITNQITLTAGLNEPRGYIWVTNDFADEKLQKETLFVRFKTEEQAKKFHDAFVDAQQEANKQNKLNENEKHAEEKNENVKAEWNVSQTAANIFVAAVEQVSSDSFVAPKSLTPSTKGSSITSTTNQTNVIAAPAAQTSIFGAASSSINKVSANADNKTNDSPFANFTFGQSTTSSPPSFANLFGNSQLKVASPFVSTSPFSTAEPRAEVASAIVSSDTASANKSSLSETEDDYVPTAQFAPVIALPDLVEVNTGEENEIVLFEYRAKLLRFDKESGEWKERGIGNMKLLQDKNDVSKVRLVMRREQIHKLCCNQRLYKDMKFNYAKGSKLALIWAGQDYSENELVTEMLSVRFKKPETCAEFLAAVEKAQKYVGGEGEGEAIKDVKKDKLNDATLPANGFGDAFKPKTGEWTCGGCYVSNKSDHLYCIACGNPKDDTVPKKAVESSFSFGAANKFTFGFPTTTTQPKTNASGAADATNTKNDSADLSYHTNSSISSNDSTISSVSDTAKTNHSESLSKEGFGDKFKPKAGAWTCEGCYVVNDGTSVYCTACENPKDDKVPKKGTTLNNSFAPSSNTPKFNFGFAAAGLTNASNKSDSDSVQTGFHFGNQAPAEANSALPVEPRDLFASYTKTLNQSPDVKPTETSAQSAPLGKSTFTFTLKPQIDETTTNSANVGSGFGFGTPASFALQKDTFSFTFKPKSPGKTGTGEDTDAADDDVVAEEENNTYFTPAIPLPDKIEVKTGEEDEDVLYVHRAKLFRFIDSEWKERGLGDVKILQHKALGKLRVVMRREHVFKICLNHVLNDDVEYKRKDDKSWLFVVNDFSEGEVALERFSLRFKNSEIAESFINTVKSALAGTALPIEETTNNDSMQTANNSENDSKDDISKEDKVLADKLQLPHDFFTTKKVCLGCRGCEPKSFVFPNEPKEVFINKDDLENPLLPLEMPVLSLPKRMNAPIIKQQSNKSGILSPANLNKAAVEQKTENKNIFSGFGNASGFSITSPLNDKTNTSGFLFGNANVSSSFGNTSDKSVFGQKPSIFGGTTTKFSFGDTSENSGGFLFGNTSAVPTNKNTEGTTTAKSIFGPVNATNTEMKALTSSHNIFSTAFAAEQAPIFGSSFATSAAEKSNLTPIFGGSSFSVSPADKNNQTPIFGTNSFDTPSPYSGGNLFSSATKKDSTSPIPDLFGKSVEVDFASLAASATKTAAPFAKSSATSGFVGLTNQNDFASFSKTINNNGNPSEPESKKNESADGDDDNYDPHFEPIIALPKEIAVVTGEEEEQKLFGERAMLFRWDDISKEWKERGVGELKVLFHPIKNSYRLLLRREQIHKLVLNHAITAQFTISEMNKNPKSFVWGCLNYAEKSEGEYEKLAIRFKKVETAAKFEQIILKCTNAAANREDVSEA